jgi:shikimate dehydrogenase
MARLNRPGLYVPLDFETEREFVDSLDSLNEWGFRGLNVTHPWKTAAIQSATSVTGRAEMCGVANILTFQGDSIEAENTDLAAALRRLEELRRSGQWDGQSLTVVGTGGAARATLAAARILGIDSSVYGRHRDSARELATAFAAHAPESGDATVSSLVVHATIVGRVGAGPLEVPLRPLLRRGGYVLDWVYAPASSEIRRQAESAGATYEDGRRLLVYQAAATFSTWWGEEPVPDAISEALREEGCTE